MTALAPLSFVRTNPYDNEASTAATISLMKQYIGWALNHPPVLRTADEVFAGLPLGVPYWRYCLAVYEWMPTHCRFVPDESILVRLGLSPDQEFLTSPYLFFQTREGDCDCFVMSTCALLGCAGIDTRIVTVAADSKQPWRWSHVYPVAILENGSRLAVDTAAAAQKRGLPMGWEPAQPFRRREW